MKKKSESIETEAAFLSAEFANCCSETYKGRLF
jgi:hypothetical protein